LYRFAFLLILYGSAAPALQSPANAPDSDREKNAYLIYSLLLTNPPTSHGPDNNERYLIASLTAVPSIPSAADCVRPPKEREADFRQVLEDFELRKGKPRELKPALTLSKPYQFLTAAEVKAFVKAASSTLEPGMPEERFRGVTDVFTLSDVYFNRRQTLALTAISSWCGSLCALYQWKVFEKSNTGKWEERPWVGCVTIAGLPRSPANR
jgi:hypothetical protein